MLCGFIVSSCIPLCNQCQNDLPRILHSCQKCGSPVLSSNIKTCGQCLIISPTVDYTFSLFHYESPVDYLIAQLKFQQQLSYAAILGYLLKTYLKSELQQGDLPEVILPVPLHKKRLFKRGFNQSLEIARPVSKQLKIPIDYKFVRRIKPTTTQTKLNIDERKRNIKGCFKLNTVPAYRHVVLIDDVVTTGATTNELAQTLKNAGVDRVGVWSVARAILQ